MSNVTSIKRPNIQIVEGEAKTTSRDVAAYFKRQHKDVIRAIEQLHCSEEFNGRNFSPAAYVDDKGEERRMYEITKDGFAFLAMGFTGQRAGEFKECYIEAFNAMEDHLRERTGLPAHAERLIEQLQEALHGGDPRSVPMSDVSSIFRVADERTSAIREQLDELDAELGYLRSALERR